MASKRSGAGSQPTIRTTNPEEPQPEEQRRRTTLEGRRNGTELRNQLLCVTVFVTLRHLSDNCVDMELTSPPYYCTSELCVVANRSGADDRQTLFVALRFEEVVVCCRRMERCGKTSVTLIAGTGDKAQPLSGDTSWSQRAAVALNHNV
jgi:hypothetical protein